jgi:hypothetical protein
MEAEKLKRRPQALIIDEVDVFFTKDFYGAIYQPSIQLTNPVFKTLIDHIWSVRHDKNELQIHKLASNPKF